MSDIDNVWKNKNVSKETKMRLRNALIIPIALYVCKTWTPGKSLNKQDRKKIMCRSTRPNILQKVASKENWKSIDKLRYEK